MKKICSLILTAVLLLSLLPSAVAADQPIFRGFNGTYQYVQLGEYPYEADGTVKPVLWRILSVEDNTLLLLTEYVIELQQMLFCTDEELIDSHTYLTMEDYADSDLCPWMNTVMIGNLFGNDPIVNAMIPEGEDGKYGKLFCLSAHQYVRSAYGFRPNKDPTQARMCAPTPYTRSRRIFRDKPINYMKGASPYWTSTLTSSIRMQIVGLDGHLSAGVFTRENIGIRPGIRLNPDLIAVTGGTGKKNDPFTLTYTGEIPAEMPEAAPPAEEENAGEEALSETGEATPAEIPSPEEEPAPAEEPVPEDEAVPAEAEETVPAEIPSPEEEPAPEEEPVSAEEAAPEEEPAPEEESAAEEETAGEAAGETAAAASEEAAPEEAEPTEKGTALVSFLGDCSIGDALSTVSKSSSYHATVDREGYAWPFSMIQQYIGTDDMTVANLEVVITTRTNHKNIKYPLRADPDHVRILQEGSIEVVNTANNHCYDFHRDGYVDTLEELDNAGIGRFGSIYYTRSNGFDDILVKDVNGIRFGFFGFSYPQQADLKHAEVLIKKLREEEHCDYIVASLHWGRETYTFPGSGNATYAKKLLDYGADMIYGHHPHVLQPIMFYKNKLILFSTGNCTFGTLSRSMDQHQGIFQATFEKTENGTVLRRLEVIPCNSYKSSDYRVYEETDPNERAKTFQILSPGRGFKECVNPPASFLETGVILFNEAGEMITDE